VKKELQLFLNQHLSVAHYKNAQDLIKTATNNEIELQSTHTIYKQAREIIHAHKINNDEYNHDDSESSTTEILRPI